MCLIEENLTEQTVVGAFSQRLQDGRCHFLLLDKELELQSMFEQELQRVSRVERCCLESLLMTNKQHIEQAALENMILCSSFLSNPPPSFSHSSSISCVTIHLSPLSPAKNSPPPPPLSSLFLPFKVRVFDLSWHIRKHRCWMKTTLSQNVNLRQKNRCVFSLMTMQFYHHPPGFQSAPKPERLKNLEEHVIL